MTDHIMENAGKEEVNLSDYNKTPAKPSMERRAAKSQSDNAPNDTTKEEAKAEKAEVKEDKPKEKTKQADNNGVA